MIHPQTLIDAIEGVKKLIDVANIDAVDDMSELQVKLELIDNELGLIIEHIKGINRGSM